MKKLLKDKIEKRSTEILVLIAVIVVSGAVVTASSDVLDAGSSSEDGLVAEYRFDTGTGNTAYDTSGNNDGTVNGASWTSGVKEGALEFEGGSDHFIVNPVDGFPDRQITTSFWVKTSDSGDGIISYDSSTTNDWLLYQSNSFRVYVGGSYVDTGISFNDGRWHHVAATWNSSDGEVKVFKDGRLEYTGTLNSGYEFGDSGGLVFGQDQDNVGGGFDSGQAFEGSLDNVHIYSEALKSSEIKSMYNSGAWRIGTTTGKDDSSKVAEFSFQHQNSSHVLDISGYNNHGERMNGVSQETSVGCKVGRCYSFDGSDDYVETPSIGSGFSEGFTAQYWVKPSFKPANDYNYHLSYESGGDYNSVFRFEQDDDTSGELDFGVYNSGWSEIITSDLKEDSWNHVAGVMDQNGNMELYINGVFKGTASVNTADMNDQADYLEIAARHNGQNNFDGKIDQVKIFNRSLSQQEIIENTQRLSSEGAVLDMRFDSGGGDHVEDYSMENNHGELDPDEVSGPSWNDNSLNFDGRDDQVTINGDSSLHMSDGTWTQIVDANANSEGDQMTALRLSGGWQTLIQKNDANNWQAGFYSGTDNNWKWVNGQGDAGSDKVVFVGRDDSIELWINGKKAAARSTTHSPPTGRDGGSGYIGSVGGSRYFKGSINEVKVYPYAMSESQIQNSFTGNVGGSIPRSCSNLPEGSSSGVYRIDPNGGSSQDSFKVYCEMEENGGGWIKLRMSNDCNNDNMFWFSKYSGIDDQESTHGAIGNQFDWSRLGHLNSQDDLVGGTCGSSTNNKGFDYVFSGTTLNDEHIQWEMYGNSDYVYTDEQMDDIRGVVNEISSTTEAFAHTNDDDGCEQNAEVDLKTRSGGKEYRITHFTSGNQQSDYAVETEEEMNNYQNVDYLIPSYADFRNDGTCSGEADHASFGYEKNYTLVRGSDRDAEDIVLSQSFDRVEVCGQSDTVSCPSGVSGEVAVDESGEANHGELANGPSEISASQCKVGKCLEFDGNDDGVNIDFTTNDFQSYTYSAWFKADDTSSGVMFGDNPDCWSGQNLYLNGGEAAFQVVEKDRNNCYEVSEPVDTNEWHHIVGVADYPNEEVRMYIDGEFIGSNGGWNGTNYQSGGYIIGMDEYSGPEHEFDGKLDEVKIHNRSLSDQEVWRLYTRGRDRSSGMSGPVARYPMQTESSPLRDISGEGNNGDLNLLGESGTFNTSDGEWKTIRFERSYEDPVVVGTTNTKQGESAIYFETRNLQSHKAEMRLCESEGGDNDGCDTHGTERAGYIVVDASSTDDIPGIEAGSFENYDANGASFSESFSSAPLVFSQPQTDRGDGEVVSWTTSRDTSGFNVQVCDQNSLNGCSGPDEEIGWIAVEPGNEPFEQAGEANNLSNEIGSSNWGSVSFSSSFSERPIGIFSVQNNDGGQDPKVDEIRNVDAAGMEMRFCELETGDNCDGHATMEYAYLAVSEGLLTYSNGNFPRYVDTKRGKALEFDGSDDLVSIPHNSVLSPSKEVTVMSWVYQGGDTSNSYQRITEKGGAITYWVDNGGDTCVRLTATEGGNSAQTCFGTDLQEDKWHHLGFSYDSDLGEVKLYKDGELFGTSSYYSGEMSGNTNDLTIGNNNGGSRPWSGKIDDVRIYPYALNSNQVKQVMNQGLVSLG